MAQEEKQLLLKDLCARLPYRVKVAIDFPSYLAWLPRDKSLNYPYRKNLNFILNYNKKTIEDISKEPNILYAYPCNGRFQMLRGYTYQDDYGVPVEFIKPYLSKISSMTEEEKKEYAIAWNSRQPYLPTEAMDWLNAHHFDYRGLIPMGLALEAPEGMYNT